MTSGTGVAFGSGQSLLAFGASAQTGEDSIAAGSVFRGCSLRLEIAVDSLTRRAPPAFRWLVAVLTHRVRGDVRTAGRALPRRIQALQLLPDRPILEDAGSFALLAALFVEGEIVVAGVGVGEGVGEGLSFGPAETPPDRTVRALGFQVAEMGGDDRDSAVETPPAVALLPLGGDAPAVVALPPALPARPGRIADRLHPVQSRLRADILGEHQGDGRKAAAARVLPQRRPHRHVEVTPGMWILGFMLRVRV